MTVANGLVRVSYAKCAVCGRFSAAVSDDPSQASKVLRQLGWKPERVKDSVTYEDLDHYTRTFTRTSWYCQDHEQQRSSLKKNGGSK